MTKCGSDAVSGVPLQERFLAIYNDLETYPQNADVAAALGRSEKTVRNYSAILRHKIEAGEVSGVIIVRNAHQSVSVEEVQLTPRDHAQKRSVTLSDAVTTLLTSSDYPVINPQVVVIEGHITTRYDRVTGQRRESEGTPRTWLTDTLRVESVPAGRNKTFIFTGAQNDAPVHMPFWTNLQAYAAAIGAKIVVGPWTYETTWWSENTPSSRTYDPVLQKHLCFGQMAIGDNFVFCGEMNTLPTASRPISDLTSYTKGRWGVFPHGRIQLVSVPSLDPTEQAFQIMTTGGCTPPRVIPRKAGVKSIFTQELGATIVEFDADGDIFPRQLIADTSGTFQDLDTMVANGVVSTGHSVEVVTAADLHLAKLRTTNCQATFGFNMRTPALSSTSLVSVLKPGLIVLHDIHDNEARNHHDAKNQAHNYEMAIRDRDNVLEEVRRSVDFLERITALTNSQILVVESNHDIALDRYVLEGRYRMDGANFRFGLDLDAAYHDNVAVAGAAREAEVPYKPFSLLEWAIRKLTTQSLDAVSWCYDGRSHIRNGIQIGHHGFRGANGSKGTVAGFARMGQKMTIGDKHSPSILDGVYGAGVMDRTHAYAKGPSGWAVSHVIQYHSGARTVVTLQNGKWRRKY